MSSSMNDIELENAMIEKAIMQALASVLLEGDIDINVDEEVNFQKKVLILKGGRNGGMGRLSYR